MVFQTQQQIAQIFKGASPEVIQSIWLQGAIFDAYQPHLLTFLNSEEGKDLLYRKTKSRFPDWIIEIGRGHVIERITEIGDTQGKNRATFYPRQPFTDLFLPLIEKASVLQIKYMPYASFADALKFYAGYRTETKYPRIYDEEIYHGVNPLLYKAIYENPMLRWDSSTFNPVGGANSPVDGYASRGGVDETFGSIRGGAGTASGTNGFLAWQLQPSNTTDQYTTMMHGFTCFDTSPLGDASTSVSGVYSIAGTSKADPDGSAQATHIASATLASTGAIANTDYQNVGRTSYANIAYASMSTAGYNDFTLSAGGNATINLTGVTQFSIQSAADINNSAPTWNTGADLHQVVFTETDAGGNIPKLVVTYTPGSSPSLSPSATPSPSPSLSISPSPSVSVSASVSPTPSISISLSPSVSVSLSVSLTPSASVSLSPSVSESLSPSLSISLSPSVSVSLSISLSPSVSVSLSMSATPSLSPSLSPSVSVSLSSSLSPSVSVSPSPSVSVSRSPSVSVSLSVSRSPSVSMSRSQSPSHSPSPSISASLSPSISDSPSPSQPESLYTREAKVSLPSAKDDLAIGYTTQEEADVYSDNGVYVALTSAATNYLIHQFKKLNTNRHDWIKVRIDLKSSLAPSTQPVYLQVWNGTTNSFETVDSNTEDDANTDFSLYGNITEQTFRDSNWYDIFEEFCCRVYQLNNSGSQSLSIDLVQISFLVAYENLYPDRRDNTYTPVYPHKNPQDDVEEEKF